MAALQRAQDDRVLPLRESLPRPNTHARRILAVKSLRNDARTRSARKW
jgi:hypothetical protein